MAFLTEQELIAMNFKSLGKNVKISDKASLYNIELMSIGDNSRIDDFCLVSGKVTIGRNVHIAAYCNVAGGIPGIEFEDFSGLAYGCHVFSQSDDYSGKTLTNPTIPDAYKREAYKSVTIGRHVIVGTQSIILPGANLAEGCSVGAMSMVTKPTKSWGVYFGIPAKRIKERSQELLKLEEKYLNESH
ncbi:acyltransferase [Vibrio furnissii]|uniref:acyltransferase n=1 Tax=Vibrio furnissii TaxID=29494 RepID=UPI0023D9EC9C|nr:acyltransferase [Vibrio furnissii]